MTSARPSGKILELIPFWCMNKVRLEEATAPNGNVHFRMEGANDLLELESGFQIILKALQIASGFSFSLDYEPIPGPGAEKYANWFLNPDVARQRAFYARKRFIMMFASISFQIAHITTQSRDHRRWIAILQESNAASRLGIDMLVGSDVSRFDSQVPNDLAFLT
jgi:hypothetical protein